MPPENNSYNNTVVRKLKLEDDNTVVRKLKMELTWN